MSATKVSMVVGLQNLERDGSDAKNLFHQEQDENEFTSNKIDEAEQDNITTFNEIKRLREEKKQKKKENEKILK